MSDFKPLRREPIRCPACASEWIEAAASGIADFLDHPALSYFYATCSTCHCKFGSHNEEPFRLVDDAEWNDWVDQTNS